MRLSSKEKKRSQIQLKIFKCMYKNDAALRLVCLTALCWDNRLLAQPPNTNTSPSGPEHAVCHSLKHTAQCKERSTYSVCIHPHPNECMSFGWNLIYKHTNIRVESMRDVPWSLCVTVFERLPFIFAHIVQPSITWKTDIFLRPAITLRGLEFFFARPE